MDTSEKEKIAAIERQIVADKPWQLRGEIGAYSRPVNSLLFEQVNFEQRMKAPKITPETTEALEAMIKQRIKDNNFDDPIKKTKPPTSSAAASTREIEISSEKSKVGLAQLYEQELISKASTGQARDGPEKEVEKRLYALIKKLDALVDR